METLNYKELKEEFYKKQLLEDLGFTQSRVQSSPARNEEDKEIAKPKTKKQQYWEYLITKNN